MEKLSFTLYEIFGYFLPGTVGMLALGILFWAIFLPTAAVHLGSWELSKLWYFGLIIVSYFAGHVLQAISRSWFPNPNDSVLTAEDAKMRPLIRAAARKIGETL